MNLLDLRQIKTLVRAMVRLAIKGEVPKHRLWEIVSQEYDDERNNHKDGQ